MSMPCVGFILRPQKRPRVLTAALSEAAQQHGVSLVALEPDSTPDQWHQAGATVIVHKVPDEPGLDERLEAFAAGHAGRVVLDPPAAVRRLQDREAMLQPFAAGPLVFTPQQDDPAATIASEAAQQRFSSVVISMPRQVVLPAGCNFGEAVKLMDAAGLQLPVLVKPLLTLPGDSARQPAAAASVAAEAQAGCSGSRSSSDTMQTGSNDGHSLGITWTMEGVRMMVQGQQQCSLSLPVVLQQYVPHSSLFKLYVIGPSCVLTRRSTLTPEMLEQAIASAPCGKQGLLLLPRISAEQLPQAAGPSLTAKSPQEQHPCTTNQAEQQQRQNPRQKQQVHCEAAAAGASATGDPTVPPLWSMQQLAAYLRRELGLNLFNVDIIAMQQHGAHADTVCNGAHEWLVVDVNYFPGYDKVPGAEPLFADFLADVAGC